jgi:vesicle coat complex subunit
MAFSQVGEYIEEPEKIDAMIPVLVQHLTHQNPKVRHASAHAIG